MPLYLAISLLILLAGVWAKFGAELPVPFTDYHLGATYVGEVIAFFAFGVAWMVSGKDLKLFSKLDTPGNAVKNVTKPRHSVAGET